MIATEKKVQETELGKEFGIILNPIETGIEEGKSARIVFTRETRLYNGCDSNDGVFGIQEISLGRKSGIGEEWTSGGIPSSFKNKYIFSSGAIEGKDYRVFAKGFEKPFKIADLIYIWSNKENYCFVDAPSEIGEEVLELDLRGIKIADEIKECSKDSKVVCFASSGCDIDVSLIGGEFRGSVEKKFSERVYFEGTEMLYGAIFADPGIYECQVKRLMKRASELALLYRAKSVFLTPSGCRTNLETELGRYVNKTLSLEKSFELSEISLLSENLRRANSDLYCKLF